MPDTLAESSDLDLTVIAAKIRVIRCFDFDPVQRQDLEIAIRKASIRERPVWRQDRINPDVIAEIPAECVDFLSGRSESGEGAQHFSLRNEAATLLFPNLSVEITRDTRVLDTCSVDNRPGWELYLGPTGIGILVFSFCLDTCSFTQLRSLTYRLA